MRTVEEQLAIVLAAVDQLTAEQVTSIAALGRVLAAPVVSRVDIPAFDNAAMDGYAVHHADVERASASAPAALRVVADVPAGSAADPGFGAGQAARIMTGAPIPAAADTVVPFEDTAIGSVSDATEIAVTAAPRALGAHVRRTGEDTRRGDTVLAAGTRIGALQLSAAVSAGASELTVSRRVRVAVISTGDELRASGAPLERGQIYDSNGPLIAALATTCGAVVTRTARVDDAGGALRALVTELTAADSAHRVDVLVFTGGVSAGAFEVVRNVLGAELEFTKIAMQPGKPQAFGRFPSGTLVFGLPGNPVSAAVSFTVFVRPALRAMTGETAPPPAIRLPAGTGWRTPPARRQYLPVVVDRSGAGWTVVPASVGGSGSHLVGGLGRAEGFAVVDSHVDEVRAGDVLDVILMP